MGTAGPSGYAAASSQQLDPPRDGHEHGAINMSDDEYISWSHILYRASYIVGWAGRQVRVPSWACDGCDGCDTSLGIREHRTGMPEAPPPICRIREDHSRGTSRAQRGPQHAQLEAVFSAPSGPGGSPSMPTWDVACLELDRRCIAG